MGKTRAELKLQARRALAGKYGVAATSILILYAIMFAAALLMEFLMIGFIFGSAAVGTMNSRNSMVGTTIGLVVFVVVVVVLMIFFTYMLRVGFTRLYYNISTNQNYSFKDLFFGFTNGLGKFIAISAVLVLLSGAVVVVAAFMQLFSIAAYVVFEIVLFVVIIWFSLTYGMFFVILVENPTRSVGEALAASARIMKGNRRRYCMLMLSFTGWTFLTYLTFGLSLLWLVPYAGCTYMMFYLDIKEKPVAAVVEEIPVQMPEGYTEEPAEPVVFEETDQSDRD